jgi:predicted DNA-binding transcriptional regulator AlpA
MASSATSQEPYLCKKQIAAHLGYSTRWVELKMREGLPSKMIGGQRRYRLSEVERWIDRQ